MKKFTVLLEGGTVGALYSRKTSEELLGLYVTVGLQDCNGNYIEVEGIIEEILEEE